MCFREEEEKDVIKITKASTTEDLQSRTAQIIEVNETAHPILIPPSVSPLSTNRKLRHKVDDAKAIPLGNAPSFYKCAAEESMLLRGPHMPLRRLATAAA